ncbi:cytochrome P450 [Nocardioides sp. LML1-1-1.1]|uniref:cytochrome P450 n=1 Tax=Nocardioides sp. LML1-1-1.1 TaxID=3135248 RepID=UPI003413CEFC
MRDAAGMAASLVYIVGQVAPVLGRSLWQDIAHRASAAKAPDTVLRTTFDPTLPASVADPYAAYSALQSARIAVNERLNVWMLTRFDDVNTAARAHDVLSSAEGIFLRSASVPSIITTDEPDHNRLRSVVSRSFSPSTVRNLEHEVRRIVEPLAAKVRDGADVDLMRDFAVPLPITMIAHMIGVPEERWADFRRWSLDLARVFSPRTVLEVGQVIGAAFPVIVKLEHLVHTEMLKRRTDPRDDILTALQRGVDEGEITRMHAYLFVMLLIVAGNDTTTNLLGIIGDRLVQDPELYARIREDRSLVPGLVEEGLRWGSPLQWVARVTKEPYEVAGHVIPKDSRVVLYFGAANRDPARFPDPHTFDPTRTTTGQLGFGVGPHFCLGAHLARLEARIAIDTLLDEVPALEPAGPLVWSTNPSLRGPKSLPVRRPR